MPPANPLTPPITQTHDRLWPKLPHWAQNKITALAAGLNPTLSHAIPSPAQLQSKAQVSVASGFPHATPEQANILVFFLLITLSGQAPPANSTPASLNLQMGMDRRSKFVEALSNVMKKIDSTQETIVQNLKG